MRASASLVILVSSLALNVVQARRVQQCLLGEAAPERTARLAIGSTVPALIGAALDGRDVELTLGGGAATVLYIFTPTCSWCTRNIDNVRALALAATDRQQRFIGISLSTAGLQEYVREHGFEFQILALSPASRGALKLGGTPQMLVVGSDGHLLKNWSGAPQGALQAEIEAFFGIRLPGLRPSRQRTAG
jgi:peroxiredoxin